MISIPQSVTRRILLKAYLSSDHVSDATGKTIAVKISKNGAAFGDPSAGATNATEIANGWYYVDLSTTDTGTTGPLIVRGTAAATDNTETHRQVVDPHNAGFDGVPAVTAGTTNGLPLAVDGSGRVDALKINGTSQTARDLGASVLLSAGTGTGQLDFTSGVLKSNTVQVLGGACPAVSVTGVPKVDVADWLGSAPNALISGKLDAALNIRSNTSQAGAAGTVTLDAGASATTDFYKGAKILLASGTGAGQARLCTAYNGSTKVATIAPNWATNPDNTSVFIVAAWAGVDVETWLATAVTAASAGTPDVNAKNLGGQTVTAGAGVTVPASIASPTNITAGTITTATNLTNAPTAGDFTAAMKTSLSAATPAVTVSDKTGFSLSAAGIQAIWDALTSALSTVNSIGKLLVTNIDALISSRTKPADTQAAVTLVATTTAVTNPVTLTSAYDAAKTAAQAGSAMTITDSTTLNAVADALLKRDWTAVSGEASHSLMNVLRGMGTRNKVTISGGTATVYKEDGATPAFTIALATSSGAQPVIGTTPSA